MNILGVNLNKRTKMFLISGIAILSSVLLSFTILIPISLNHKRKKSHAATTLSSSTSTQTLSSGEYIVNSNVTITGENTGDNGITIAEGATVTITVNKNCTLTATGKAAGLFIDRSSLLPKFYYYGGGAGIYVPESSTLILKGEGTVIATGGNASNGSKGSDGEDAYSGSWNQYYCGTGGSGGRGGSGAGAGIGGSGGVGGSGGTNAGDSGSNGSSGTTSGKIYILGNLTVNATAGNEGGSGSGGIAGIKKEVTQGDILSHFKEIYYGGGGGGGGGAGAAPTYDIGDGGPGSGGGAAGYDGKRDVSTGSGGKGGRSYNESLNGADGSGGTNGTGGSGGSAGTYSSNSCVYYSSGATINGSYLGTCITSTATFDKPEGVVSIKEGETELTGDALKFEVGNGSAGISLTGFNLVTSISASEDYTNDTLTYTFTDFYNTSHTIVYYIENAYYISDTDIPSSFNADETITPSLDYKTYEFIFE